MFTHFRKKAKFICIIGEDGAVLTYIEGKKMVSRLFAPSCLPADRKECDTLLEKYPNAPLYVLIDSIEQSYTKQVLPAVSPLSIGKLVKKRLERDFAETDIKGAVGVGRMESGRKDWLYMFASLPMTDALVQWLDYLIALPNPFMGIYMLPIEMESFALALRDLIYTPDNPVKASDWQFLVTHNKTGGFRQVVLHKKRVVFTRMIRPGKETIPDIIAGNIEQEILNTVDYLRRLSFNDGDVIDTWVIASKDIKHGLRDMKIRGRNIVALTPAEVCSRLRYQEVASESDKFADLLLAAYFANISPQLRLFIPKTKKLYSMMQLYRGSWNSMAVILPLMLIYIGVLGVEVIRLHMQIQHVTLEKKKIDEQWKSAQTMDHYNREESDKVTAAVQWHRQLSVPPEDPLHIISDLVTAQRSYARVASLNWRYQLAPNSKVRTDTKEPAKEKGALTAVFNMKFYNVGTGVEQLLQNFDYFSKQIRQTFSSYQVEHTKLPDKISFQERKPEWDVQLTIKSK